MRSSPEISFNLIFRRAYIIYQDSNQKSQAQFYSLIILDFEFETQTFLQIADKSPYFLDVALMRIHTKLQITSPGLIMQQ